MNRVFKYFKELPSKMKVEAVIAISLTIAATITIPAYAWFTNQKKLGDLERVDTPTKLFITAAHDDIKYLALTDIQVTGGDKKKYYVFGVSGKSASYYHLQLAYTTNNQFEYFIYPAKQVTANAAYLVSHTAHDEAGEETTTYYYAIDDINTVPASNTPFTGNESYRLWSEVPNNSTATKMKIRNSEITTRYINKEANSLIANSTKHDDTYHYGNYDAEDEVNVGAQLYSEPIYWQALRINSGMDASNTFENYYILEVNWEKAAAAAGEAGLKDDKETDIIYIAAEATS